jgi:hypothetical protein
MPDLGKLIPESWNKWIGAVLTVYVLLAVMGLEGEWWTDFAAQQITRSTHVIAALSSIFGWGVVVKKVSK